MVSLCLAVLVAAAPSPVPRPPSSVPAEIARHYRDHNLVTAFSTPSERHEIAAGRVGDDERLRRLARLMRRLESRVVSVDPEVAADPMAAREIAFRSDVVRVAAWWPTGEGDEGWVTLEVTTLDRGSNVTLVGRYEELAGEGRSPSVETLLSHAAPGIVATERHHWRRVGGEWRRDEATQHFLVN